jgi:hypothetical protein
VKRIAKLGDEKRRLGRDGDAGRSMEQLENDLVTKIVAEPSDYDLVDRYKNSSQAKLGARVIQGMEGKEKMATNGTEEDEEKMNGRRKERKKDDAGGIEFTFLDLAWGKDGKVKGGEQRRKEGRQSMTRDQQASDSVPKELMMNGRTLQASAKGGELG